MVRVVRAPMPYWNAPLFPHLQFAPRSPHHVIQRAEFRLASDRRSYLDVLRDISQEWHVEVLGYCIMRTHSHVIVGANSSPNGLRAAVRRLSSLPSRSPVALASDDQAFRRRPWSGRMQVFPIKTDAYLLNCLRYVDRNPVEDGIVKRPEEYEWSSYRAHIGLDSSVWLKTAPCISALADTTEEQQVHYRSFVERECTANAVD